MALASLSDGICDVLCSKLANIWFAYELQRREPQLVVPTLHPGVINTTIGSPGWAHTYSPACLLSMFTTVPAIAYFSRQYACKH